MAIRLTPIAGESLGVRSMAAFVETPDVRVLLDAGAGLGWRYNLMPHPLEYRALGAARKRLREFAEKADIITVSHYHYDHYTATWREVEAQWTWSCLEEARKIYTNKLVCAKDYRENINPSQRRRGWIFSLKAPEFSEVRYVDGVTMKFGDTEITFSRPFPHGEEGQLGFVLCILIERDGERLLYCPDVQGPMEDATMTYIGSVRPRVLVVGGPPTYLADSKVPRTMVERGIRNLRRLAATIPLLLVEHHMLRDEQGWRLLSQIREQAKAVGNTVQTYAEYLGEEVRPLESQRQRLYSENPPSEEFQRWLQMPPRERARQLPPA
jgi:predicted metallo-beta-lactamase superfamily hydrolase